MAPKTPKGAKRTEKEPIEKDAAPKAAKEEADQTASAAAAAAVPEEPKLAEEAKGTELPDSNPVNATAAAEEGKAVQPQEEPAKAIQGDPLTKEAGSTAANGSAKAAEPETAATTKAAEPEPATAAGVEAGKTKEHEEPQAAAEGKKVVEPGIGEAKPVGEAE